MLALYVPKRCSSSLQISQSGECKANIVFLAAGATWLIDAKQELRVKLQAVGLDAEAKQAWLVGADGQPVPSSTPIKNFTLRDMGFQIRYRKEIAPLSYLYIAYVRGGSLFGDTFGPVSLGSQISNAFSLRDCEQLFVKLSYRFEL